MQSTGTILLCLYLAVANAQTIAPAGAGWPTYGGDAGGSRYSASAQINKKNVSQLKVAWIFHTGINPEGSLETTPILFKGSLYLSSPTDHVYSIDPTIGQQRWSFDPKIDKTQSPILVTSRGVASWSNTHGDTGTVSAKCADRIFLGTLDARLIALDAASGELCADFGVRGSVDLTQNVDYRQGDDYRVTSPRTVIGDVVVVGSGIGDSERVDVELGDVRGFDVRSGKLLWTWEPMPWAKGQKLRTGGGNTWGVIAADLEHGLIYLPTSSPSPDHYGGMRPGDNRDADSIVALDGRTGRKVWSFQVVHHNVWDYDIAAEPLLFTFHGRTPAVAVATKMGLLFVFNRLTGEPLYPIQERPVPQSDVPGEVTSPTQPFPDLPPLAPITLDMSRQLGANAAADADCRKLWLISAMTEFIRRRHFEEL
jgi:quinoprotein glucose dehydrogenase